MLTVSVHRVRRGTEHPQETLKDLLVCGRGLRAVAVQIDVQLAVRETVADRVRPVQHQRRLTDTRGTGHQQYPCVGRTVVKQTVKRLTLSAPVDESLPCQRELAWHRT
jgi:hypothetical protein